jgi:hypothetical protein
MPYLKSTFYAIFSCLIFLSCKVAEVQNAPSVTTNKASDIKIKSVLLNGEVTVDGFSPTIERGFVFSDKNSNPTISDNKLISGNGKGPFSALLSNLSVATKYYFRAFAINSIGTSFGLVENFTTTDYELPSVQIELPTNITYSSVELNGLVTKDGGGNISEIGFVLSINPSPKTTDMKFSVLKNGLSPLKYVVEKLNFNTKYYVRFYAINEKGTVYSNELNFVTLNYTYLKNTTIVDVKSVTGRIWMDRNLGASRAALSINDELSFGNLFQWGRLADGHESRTSQTTNSISNNYIPGNSLFILNSGDWLLPQNNFLWSNDLNNNPCPTGYSIPTEEELANEIKTWSTLDAYGAFNSLLKLPFAGFRNGETGVLETGFSSAYWTKTTGPKPAGSNSNTSRILGSQLTSLNFFSNPRTYGFSCRCIKNL